MEDADAEDVVDDPDTDDDPDADEDFDADDDPDDFEDVDDADDDLDDDLDALDKALLVPVFSAVEEGFEADGEASDGSGVGLLSLPTVIVGHFGTGGFGGGG